MALLFGSTRDYASRGVLLGGKNDRICIAGEHSLQIEALKALTDDRKRLW
jgi:hypothetical protein